MEPERASRLGNDLARRYRAVTDTDLSVPAEDLVVLTLGWIAGGPDRDHDDIALAEVYDGIATLVLLGEAGVRVLTVPEADEPEVTVRYLPPLRGGQYGEQFRNVGGQRVELDMAFSHDEVPTLGWSFATMREIDTPEVSRIRDLLRGWAESVPN